MKKENKKKVTILTIIAVVVLLLVVIGATFAYFQAQGGGTGNIDVNANTATTDNLSFQIGGAISLTANQEDFGSGMPNKSGSTTASATLTANNATNNATKNYYVYLDITSNDFEYTTENNQAELLLKVTGPDGAEVTTLGSLERKTSGGETGFDITTSTGLITIADNYEITSTGTVTQEWQIEVIFANLDSDQNANTGKTFSANLIIQEEEIVTLANYVISQYTTDGENGLYYHDGLTQALEGTCKYNDVDVYNSLVYMQSQELVVSNNSTYCQKVYQVTIDGTPMLYLDNSAGTLIENVGPVMWDTSDNTCKTQNGNNLVVNAMFQTVNQESCIGDAYLIGSFYVAGLSEAGSGSFENTIVELSEEAGDNSYRYSGANPNNFVCFGSTESPCPTENLYRIIGTFDDDKDGNYQIKLIKADYVTSAMLGTDGKDYAGAYSFGFSNYKGNMETSTIATYRWNYDISVSTYGSNNWTTSEFNKINLNTNYWNYLGTTWQSLIAEATWHLGGMEDVEYTAKEFYDGERNNAGYGSNPTTYTDEIGLMYPSDYGYAASPDAWATNIGSYSNSTITSSNWLYMGLIEWTITPRSSNSYIVFFVNNRGNLSYSYAYSGLSARPVFYLESNAQLEGGNGTSSDPYRLAV